MLYDFDTLVKQLRQIQLQTDEKSSLRHRLEAYQHMRPISSEHIGFVSAFQRVFFRGSPMIAFSLLLCLFVGLSYQAEGALPGNLLYPVKVDFTEHVRDALTFSDEDHIDWDIQKAERRQQEDELLATNLGI